MSGTSPAPSRRPRGPAVSVIVPTFDRMPYLRTAVESVLAQSIADWELIVVDDGSTDATAPYLGSIHDPRVRYVRIPHTGNPSRVRNEGLAYARGEYVAFLDSDDVWHPRKLEVQIAAMLSGRSWGWSYTDVDYIDAASAALPRSRFAETRPRSGWIVEELVTHRTVIVCSSVMARRRLVASVGGFDESLRYCQDFDLWLRLAVRAEAVGIRRSLVDARLHAGHGRGRPEATAALIRVHGSFARSTPVARLRRACRRQQDDHRVRLAHQLIARGRRRAAVRPLRAALPARAAHPRLWAAVLKLCLPRSLALRLGRAARRIDGPREGRSAAGSGPS